MHNQHLSKLSATSQLASNPSWERLNGLMILTRDEAGIYNC